MATLSTSEQFKYTFSEPSYNKLSKNEDVFKSPMKSQERSNQIIAISVKVSGTSHVWGARGPCHVGHICKSENLKTVRALYRKPLSRQQLEETAEMEMEWAESDSDLSDDE